MGYIRWTSHHGHEHALSVGVYPDIDEFRLDLSRADLTHLGMPAMYSNLTRDAARQLHTALSEYLGEGCATHGTVDAATLSEREPRPIPACDCDQEPYQ